SWTGMRGIVSLAAALALPLTLPDGTPFAERSLLVFLSYVVILLTLIIPTLTLPWLVRRLDLADPNERLDDEVRARIAMAEVAAQRLHELRGNKRFSGEVLDDFESRYQSQLNRLRPNLEANAYSVIDPAEQQRRALLLELFESERSVLHDLRSH